MNIGAPGGGGGGSGGGLSSETITSDEVELWQVMTFKGDCCFNSLLRKVGNANNIPVQIYYVMPLG